MKLADIFAFVVPEDRGVAFRAFDGSTAGPNDAEVALEHMLRKSESPCRRISE